MANQVWRRAVGRSRGGERPGGPLPPAGEGERSRSEGMEALFRRRAWRAALLSALLRRSPVG
uniref:Alcohol dehydrogenase 5 (class III), chi polypeptide n=1 Tax=Mus musculus TaxID=10090 RepID=A0A0G2JDX2_MOUSE